ARLISPRNLWNLHRRADRAYNSPYELVDLVGDDSRLQAQDLQMQSPHPAVLRSLRGQPCRRSPKGRRSRDGQKLSSVEKFHGVPSRMQRNDGMWATTRPSLTASDRHSECSPADGMSAVR